VLERRTSGSRRLTDGSGNDRDRQANGDARAAQGVRRDTDQIVRVNLDQLGRNVKGLEADFRKAGIDVPDDTPSEGYFFPEAPT